ncbi:MAG: polysaccharide biosynthesis tyrosine autokinase [Calothrix sp. MO_167.B12]|nr:polysaccharide biosynthesis tyrosine autokinase [Calothrix sp. MO_167.B12]
MKNPLYPLSSPERNGNSTFPILETQPFPWSESQNDDWSLRDFLDLARRRMLVIAGVASVAMAVVSGVTLSQTAEYEGNFRLLVEPVSNEDNGLPNLKVGGNANLTGKQGLDYESQIQVLKSPEIMKDIVKQLQVSYPGINYGNLQNDLTISRLGNTKLIEIRYRNQDPAKIKVVLQQIADSYLNYSLEKRQTKLRQGLQFVDKQLPTIKDRFERLQKELEIFRRKNNFINPDSQGNQINEQLRLLSQQRLAVNQELAKARANFQGLQGEEGALAILNSAPVYQDLVLKVRELETKIAGESTRFLEDSPSMRSLKEKRAKLLPILRQEASRVVGLKLAEAASEIRTLQERSQTLAQTEKQLQIQFQRLPILARRYTQLQQQLKVAQESLQKFVTTRENLQIEAAQTELPWQLVQAPSEPQNPVSPNIRRSLMLGFVASILLGFGSALLIEKLDNTYHSLEELKQKLKLPILGTIPLEKQLQKLSKNSNSDRQHKIEKPSLESTAEWLSPEIPGMVATDAKTNGTEEEDYFYQSPQFLEAFRMLHTNIHLLSSDRQIRSLVITSAMPGDGKSTVAFHLGQIAAAMGKRVLLVDADLRKPRIHRISKLKNIWGLTNLISSNMPHEQVIQQMAFSRNFSVITSGQTPPDPTKLLASEKMRGIMKDVESTYDLVIYDAPPILGLADASLLAPSTDGIILVNRMQRTDRSALKQTLDTLRMSRVNVLGMVVNGHNSRLSNYYNKYYYYNQK